MGKWQQVGYARRMTVGTGLLISVTNGPMMGRYAIAPAAIEALIDEGTAAQIYRFDDEFDPSGLARRSTSGKMILLGIPGSESHGSVQIAYESLHAHYRRCDPRPVKVLVAPQTDQRRRY